MDWEKVGEKLKTLQYITTREAILTRFTVMDQSQQSKPSDESEQQRNKTKLSPRKPRGFVSFTKWFECIAVA